MRSAIACDGTTMNLLINALKTKAHELAQTKGLFHARVLHKVNARGELVVAIIVPPSRPGEWSER